WICNEIDVPRGDAARVAKQAVALRSFDYSATVKEAIAAAGRSRLARPMAALHLRSGDIVHGKHRASLIFAGKVIPSTLA
ncbi:hypothetical protein, partial [Klebsiella pneumoniae]|uniref:hypothetical protein n=1 Tax=Klebsiella pneumoniae TaxID=573 RepID=UPI0019531B67